MTRKDIGERLTLSAVSKQGGALLSLPLFFLLLFLLLNALLFSPTLNLKEFLKRSVQADMTHYKLHYRVLPVLPDKLPPRLLFIG